MDSSVSIPTLRCLGNNPHRIEWFGQVYRGGASSLAVVFAPWGIDPESGEMLSNTVERKTVLVPLPFLRLFRIGDIWQNCRFTEQRDNQARETFHLAVQENSVQVMPAGAPLNADPRNPVYPLPFSTFDAHRDHTLAQCARIEVVTDTMLVIPCMELIRFYFGASGSFLKRLFSGAFALDKLILRKRRGANSQVVNIDLADDLRGAAATTVARIAFDPQARSAAAWIVNSGMAAAANKSGYYPKTTFPFYGETDLTVDGRWIEQEGRRIFLAEQIKRCTHPFPFETLFYTTRKSSLVQKTSVDQTKQSESAEQNIGAIPNADHQLVEGPVSSVLLPVDIPVTAEIDEPFPDLSSKKIRRVKQEAGNGANAPRDDALPELAAGDETSSTDTRAAEVTHEIEDSTFDEETIEELPTRTVEVFREAFSVYRSIRVGRPHLVPPIAIDGKDPRLPGPFVRGSDACGETDRLLDQIWCAVIDSSDNPVGLTLVLIRDGDQEESNDHLLLVGIDRTSEATETIKRYCREYSRRQLSDQLMDHILMSSHTHSTTRMTSLLRDFMCGIEWAGQISKPKINPLREMEQIPKGLLEQPLISEADLYRLLGKL